MKSPRKSILEGSIVHIYERNENKIMLSINADNTPLISVLFANNKYKISKAANINPIVDSFFQ